MIHDTLRHVDCSVSWRIMWWCDGLGLSRILECEQGATRRRIYGITMGLDGRLCAPQQEDFPDQATFMGTLPDASGAGAHRLGTFHIRTKVGLLTSSRNAMVLRTTSFPFSAPAEHLPSLRQGATPTPAEDPFP
jgi:hypothetical protein